MSIHDKIAADAFPNGAWLKCHDPRCDRGERVTTATAAEYLAHGWPQHCGQTMRLVTEPRTSGAPDWADLR
jgi:hypothetical protein